MAFAVDGPITFHQVDMVCHAAPHIGCGSRAKPLLVELEGSEAVEEAWLDREGTVVGLVWKKGIAGKEQQTIVRTHFAKHGLEVHEVNGKRHAALLKEFRAPGRWYRGIAVDELSKEEAGVIADRIVKALKEADIAPSHAAPAIREDIRMIFEEKFLAMKSLAELDEAAEAELEDRVQEVVVRHTGEENAPRVELLLQQRDKYEPQPGGPGCADRTKACCKPTAEKGHVDEHAHGEASIYLPTGQAPMTCKLMSKELIERKNTVLASLRTKVIEKQEMDNGYAFRFHGDDAVVSELMEFIKTERECCPFFTFDLSVAGDKSVAWLRLTGPEGVKEVIQTELEL